MKTGSIRWLSVLVLGVAVAACGGAEGSDGLTVIVSTNVLGDIVGNIVQSHGSVDVLVPVGADPHDYQLSASQAADMANADLVVVNGLGLEEGMLDVVASLEEDGANVLEIARLVDPLPFAESVCDPLLTPEGCDPHVWMDPLRMIEAVAAIEEQLAAVQPEVNWSETADAYASELSEMHTQVDTLLSGIPSANRRLVTNHDSLRYLASRYGFDILGVVIPGGPTLADPSAAALAELVAVMRKEDARVIFADTSSPEDLADAVATEVGEDVEVVDLYTGSLGERGTEAGTYIGMIRSDAMLIAEALG